MIHWTYAAFHSFMKVQLIHLENPVSSMFNILHSCQWETKSFSVSGIVSFCRLIEYTQATTVCAKWPSILRTILVRYGRVQRKCLVWIEEWHGFFGEHEFELGFQGQTGFYRGLHWEWITASPPQTIIESCEHICRVGRNRLYLTNSSVWVWSRVVASNFWKVS